MVIVKTYRSGFRILILFKTVRVSKWRGKPTVTTSGSIYLGAVSLSKRRSGEENCSQALLLNKSSNRMMDGNFILIRDKILAEFACATLSRHPEYTVQASELRDNSRRDRREMWILQSADQRSTGDS